MHPPSDLAYASNIPVSFINILSIFRSIEDLIIINAPPFMTAKGLLISESEKVKVELSSE